MKIIVASDSHGSNGILNVLYEMHYKDARFFLHCGDLCEDPRNYPEWIFVQGNNDYWGRFARQRIIKVGKHSIFMIHSDKCSYFHREEELARMAKGYDCDIVCYGHTHRSYVGTIDGVHLLNPGSITYPRDGNPPSYAIMEIKNANITSQIVFLDNKKVRFY